MLKSRSPELIHMVQCQLSLILPFSCVIICVVNMLRIEKAMCVCVCVFVCERKRERAQRQRQRHCQKVRGTHLLRCDMLK